MPKKQQTQLSQEMIENIKGYKDKFVTLNDFVDQVRQTPDVYIGPLGNEGYITLFREIFQNCIDEILKHSWGESPATTAIVSFDQREMRAIFEDDGRGIPHGEIERIIMSDHTSSNYHKKPYQYTSGKNGMGIGIVNALSSYFDVQSSILGETHQVEFKEGHPIYKEKKIKSDKYQGTVITFTPCADLGFIDITWEDVFKLISDIVPETPIGTRVIFNAIDLQGAPHVAELVNEDGIMTHLINITDSPMITPIKAFLDTGEMRAEVLFTWDMSDDQDMNIKSFNNFCPTLSTPESMHVSGFIDGLVNYFTKYMNNIYMASAKKKLAIVKQDILCSLRAVVNTALLEPKYHGQSKNILANKEMRPFIAGVVQNALAEWEKANPKDLQKVCKFIKDMAEIRTKNDTAKINIKKQYKSNVYNSLPEVYVPPTGKNNLEMVIVEGKSAKQPAVDGRDITRQGILPIRGKFPNVYGTSEADILRNAEAAAIISILDGGEGTNVKSRTRHTQFDINKCKYEKVIIMTDADEDGKGHIRPLLMKFFLMYMPELILDGRLYAAIPPLYGGLVGKNKRIYFSSDLELAQYLQKEFTKNNVLHDARDNKMSNAAISNLIVKNIGYDIKLDNMADGFSLEPHLLEIILNNYEGGYKAIKSVIEKKYRFIKVTKEHGLIMVRGPLGDKIRTMPVDNELIERCRPLIEIIKRSEEYYKLNGKLVSLYDLIKAFNQYKPKNITRYKGLGEMTAEQLKYSTLHPDYDRTLIRYTIEDIKEEMKEIRSIESDFSVLLRDIRKPDMIIT